MSKTIYVGNLSYNTTETELQGLFAQHGNVLSARVITDRETGRPRGFGFVEMEDGPADAAIRELNGKDFNGRALRLNEAKGREQGPRRSFDR